MHFAILVSFLSIMILITHALRERSVTGVTKRRPYEGGGEDPNDRKGKLPKKTCGNGSPTTTYGAPTGDKEFNVIRARGLRLETTPES